MGSWWARCSSGGGIAPTLHAVVACPVPGRSPHPAPRAARPCRGRVLEDELGGVRGGAAGGRGLVVTAAGGLPGGDLGHQRGQRHRQRHPTDRVPPGAASRGQQARASTRSSPATGPSSGLWPPGARAARSNRSAAVPHRSPHPPRVAVGEGGEQVGGGRSDPVAALTACAQRGPAAATASSTSDAPGSRRLAGVLRRAARPALLQPRQGQVGGQFAAAVEHRLPRRRHIAGAGELVAEQVPRRRPPQLDQIPALPQEGDELLDVAGSGRGLLGGAASSTRAGTRPCRPAFSNSPRCGRGAAVPSGAAVTINPRRCSIRRAAARSFG